MRAASHYGAAVPLRAGLLAANAEPIKRRPAPEAKPLTANQQRAAWILWLDAHERLPIRDIQAALATTYAAVHQVIVAGAHRAVAPAEPPPGWHERLQKWRARPEGERSKRHGPVAAKHGTAGYLKWLLANGYTINKAAKAACVSVTFARQVAKGQIYADVQATKP